MFNTVQCQLELVDVSTEYALLLEHQTIGTVWYN